MKTSFLVAGAALLALTGVASAQRPGRIVVPPRTVPTQNLGALPETGVRTFNPTLVGRAQRNFPVNARISVRSPSIFRARGGEGASPLNQNVTVRGFYYDGSIPMLVDSIERTQVNTMMPPESYVPLSSRLPAVQPGDEIALTGQLVLPATAGLQLFDEPSVLRVAGDTQITRIAPAASRWRNLRLAPIGKSRFKSMAPNDGIKKRYAVLIAGGANSANNHARYWNELKEMYLQLKSRGYEATNIRVIYADGKARDDGMPVMFSATKGHIQAVFKDIGGKMDAGDSLFVMCNDHGGGFLDKKVGDSEPGSHGGKVDTTDTIGIGWKEADYDLDLNGDGDKNDTVHFQSTLTLWGDSMTGDEFRDALAQVKFSQNVMIEMEQCFSGGILERIAGKNRVAMSAAGPNEFSWGRSANYNEFTYHFLAALMGQQPEDLGTLVNADSDGDNKVSLLEAWNYARQNDASGETPHYADSNHAPGTGAMPAGFHGKWGGKSWF